MVARNRDSLAHKRTAKSADGRGLATSVCGNCPERLICLDSVTLRRYYLVTLQKCSWTRSTSRPGLYRAGFFVLPAHARRKALAVASPRRRGRFDRGVGK